MNRCDLVIHSCDVEPGMKLILEPDACPVTVIAIVGSQVSIMMPARDVFTVPISSLRRVGKWRDAGIERQRIFA